MNALYECFAYILSYDDKSTKSIATGLVIKSNVEINSSVFYQFLSSVISLFYVNFKQTRTNSYSFQKECLESLFNEDVSIL